MHSDNNANYYIEASVYDRDSTDKKVGFTFRFLLVVSCIFTFLFFISWCVSISRVFLILPNGGFFSSVFYFLNWEIWRQLFLPINEYSQLFKGAYNLEYVIFLGALYISIYTFVINLAISITYLTVSIYYDRSLHKKIALWSFVPVFNAMIFPVFLSYFLYLWIEKKVKAGLFIKPKLVRLVSWVNGFREELSPKEFNKYDVLKVEDGSPKGLIKRLKRYVDKRLGSYLS